MSFFKFLGVLGFSLDKQNQAAKKSARAQQEANDLQRRQQALEQARERRKQLQESRIRQGTLTQAAVNQGVATSSSFLGSFGSVGTQTSNNLGFLNQSELFSNLGTAANNRAVKANYESQLWGNISNLIIQGASFAGGKG